MASRPYELRLTSKYNKYPVEKTTRMGRCANKTTQPRPSLSLRSQATGTQSTTRLGLHHSGDVTFGHWDTKLPILNLAKFKIWHFWPKSPNLMPTKYFTAIGYIKKNLPSNTVCSPDGDLWGIFATSCRVFWYSWLPTATQQSGFSVGVIPSTWQLT